MSNYKVTYITVFSIISNIFLLALSVLGAMVLIAIISTYAPDSKNCGELKTVFFTVGKKCTQEELNMESRDIERMIGHHALIASAQRDLSEIKNELGSIDYGEDLDKALSALSELKITVNGAIYKEKNKKIEVSYGQTTYIPY